MLPGSGNRRIRRERSGAKGRTQEIQRLIGRSLRQAVFLDKMGERTITIDCDVLVADGGTRVASIVGGAVALRLAIKRQIVERKMKEDPFRGYVSALSLGVVGNDILLDLCYDEDSRAIMDMNVVISESGELVELQATAEGGTVPIDTVNRMTEKAISAIRDMVIPLQKEATAE
jgi:ribonuclease PH